MKVYKLYKKKFSFSFNRFPSDKIAKCVFQACKPNFRKLNIVIIPCEFSCKGPFSSL